MKYMLLSNELYTRKF